MKRILRIAQLVSFFVVGWVTTPLMVLGTTDAIRGLVGMLAAIIGAGITGYRLGQEDTINELEKLVEAQDNDDPSKP